MKADTKFGLKILIGFIAFVWVTSKVFGADKADAYK